MRKTEMVSAVRTTDHGHESCLPNLLEKREHVNLPGNTHGLLLASLRDSHNMKEVDPFQNGKNPIRLR